MQTRGHFTDYSSSHRAGTFNEVALTALPAFLSMVPPTLVSLFPPFPNFNHSYELLQMKKPRSSFAEMVDLLLSNAAYRPSFHMDVTLREGWDTAPLLVHMGRDHGLPSYTSTVSFCRNISKEITFQNLHEFGISEKGISMLRKLYTTAADIDLLAGGLLETPLPGSIVGPTFNCLLRHQFSLLRRSDRFWYENDLPPSSLTTEQLQEIRKVTLAGLLCANTDGLNKVQPMAFVVEDPYL